MADRQERSGTPDVGVVVERREVGPTVFHGAVGGLLAGLVLGATAIVSTVALGGSASTPFRFVAAFAIGPQALSASFPLGPALLLGTAVHLGLSTIFGVAYSSLLALTYQQSARWWLLVVYGSAFAFVIWEVNFLAAVPALFPGLVGTLDLGTQLWNGVVSYTAVYGPALGLYAAWARPNVVDDWRAAGAPAGTFTPVGSTGERA